MPTGTCLVCDRKLDATELDGDAIFCRDCEPSTCYWCSASDVHYDTQHIYCSHGCEHTLQEYAHHHHATVLMNADPPQKLAYGGPHIEIIIPTGTPITVYESLSTIDFDAVPDSHILTTHYTTAKDTVLRDGIEYPPHDNADERADWSHGTIREHAVYAWPYTPSYADETLTWGEHPDADPVIFSVPEGDVKVSSYDFLWWLGESDRDEETSHLLIPYEKYETELVFDPECLYTAAEAHGRPCTTDNLLLYTHRDQSTYA